VTKRNNATIFMAALYFLKYPLICSSSFPVVATLMGRAIAASGDKCIGIPRKFGV
jgi:hypothetical protein